MPKDRKVDVFPQPDSLADKLRKRRQYIEEEDVEGLQKTAEEIRKKKRNGEDED